jgi:hypothetical protein
MQVTDLNPNYVHISNSTIHLAFADSNVYLNGIILMTNSQAYAVLS